jgi:hypothetical protein
MEWLAEQKKSRRTAPVPALVSRQEMVPSDPMRQQRCSLLDRASLCWPVKARCALFCAGTRQGPRASGFASPDLSPVDAAALYRSVTVLARWWDREFESAFLQRRVYEPSVPLGACVRMDLRPGTCCRSFGSNVDHRRGRPLALPPHAGARRRCPRRRPAGIGCSFARSSLQTLLSFMADAG